MIGAIKVIADATDSAVVRIIYGLSLAMLVNFFYSYIVQFDLKVFEHLTDRGFAKLLDFLLGLAFALAATGASWWLIAHVAGLVAEVKVQ